MRAATHRWTAADPQPFQNMEMAMTRDGSDYGNPYILNIDERLYIHSIIAAYTINSARAMSLAAELGTLEAGKKADFIVIDQNLVELADKGRLRKSVTPGY
ncbi:amidohydrolase family protein [Microbulbifer sp. ZKSA006]|uniref:amidohydrolase family protein n=1 Tax=Microbulbifer sp. ZKSA006 TaxID=3243390 RepID=UPI0040398226